MAEDQTALSVKSSSKPPDNRRETSDLCIKERRGEFEKASKNEMIEDFEDFLSPPLNLWRHPEPLRDILFVKNFWLNLRSPRSNPRIKVDYLPGPFFLLPDLPDWSLSPTKIEEEPDKFYSDKISRATFSTWQFNREVMQGYWTNRTTDFFWEGVKDLHYIQILQVFSSKHTKGRSLTANLMDVFQLGAIRVLDQENNSDQENTDDIPTYALVGKLSDGGQLDGVYGISRKNRLTGDQLEFEAEDGWMPTRDVDCKIENLGQPPYRVWKVADDFLRLSMER